jgi:heme oxygenase (mycobilin-producing)
VSAVILIYPLEVPLGTGRGSPALLGKSSQLHMRRQSGFISTRLHQALLPEARFAYVNIAEWESAEHFEAAISREEFKKLTESNRKKS